LFSWLLSVFGIAYVYERATRFIRKKAFARHGQRPPLPRYVLMIKSQFVRAVAQRGGALVAVIFAATRAMTRRGRIQFFSALTAIHSSSMPQSARFMRPAWKTAR
jgi:hypothetical protein